MIISHQHRFIFLRTEKTAGSSIEYALARFCGPGDMATGISHKVAREFGLSVPWTKHVSRRTGMLRRQFPRYFGLHAHATAAQVKDCLPKKVFASYFKFAVERNPWDRQVSGYFQRIRRYPWRTANFNRDFSSRTYRALHYVRIKNWEVYSLGDEIIADEVIRYEDLDDGLARIASIIGLSEKIQLERWRSGYRPTPSYREFYTAETRELIAEWYSREISAFGYEF